MGASIDGRSGKRSPRQSLRVASFSTPKESGLTRRHDYQVDIAGSFPAAQYVYDPQEFRGFWFPTKRRAHPRNADLTADRGRTYVWIDVSDVVVGDV